MSHCIRKNGMVTFMVVALGVTSVIGSFTSCSKYRDQVISDDKSGAVLAKNGENMDQLVIEDLTVGTGAVAQEGQRVSVHYTGTLVDGTKFDSSLDRNTPFSFRLGAGEVIQGWDEGVKGMKIGGKRKLVIPPSKGYGSRPVGPIPANSTLVFEVELLNVR